jgi:hypothetical protein
MTLKRLTLAVLSLAFLAAAVYWTGQAGWQAVADDPERPTGVRMAELAGRFLDSLDEKQTAKGAFDFDDKERTNWNFVPLQDNKKPLRKGLRLDEMNAKQKEAAMALLRSGVSNDGYAKATTIMSLEAILKALEQNPGNERNPEWYFVTVFGKPAKGGKWGWRVEGHHLSLNFTLDGGKVLAATPAFFGANPAKVMDGDKKGLRTLPEAEDYAQELFASLDDDQRKVASQPKQFPEIEQAKPTTNVGDSVGLPAAKLTDKQRDVLMKLVKGYADRMPPEVGALQVAEVKDAGVEKIHFAFHRDDDQPGKPYTYRVQGPTFVIEFLNVQEDGAKNPANHIHSSWRNLKGDFGVAAK